MKMVHFGAGFLFFCPQGWGQEQGWFVSCCCFTWKICEKMKLELLKGNHNGFCQDGGGARILMQGATSLGVAPRFALMPMMWSSVGENFCEHLGG